MTKRAHSVSYRPTLAGTDYWVHAFVKDAEETLVYAASDRVQFSGTAASPLSLEFIDMRD